MTRRPRPGAGLTTRVFRAVAAVAVVAGVGGILTAGNALPPTGIGANAQGVSANSLKPAACNGITPSRVLAGSGNLGGSGQSELLLGSSGADNINTGGGSDCALGGGGDDTIRGGGGTDICIGGPGTDTFISCETAIQ